jgi:signal transduction histidine kinase
MPGPGSPILDESDARVRFGRALAAANVVAWDWELASGRRVLAGGSTGVVEETETAAAFWEAVHPDDRAAVRAAFEAAVSGGDGATYRAEYRRVEADGGVRWVLDRGRVAAGPGGAAERLVGAAVGVNEIKAGEQAFREADRRKDEFLATLAHELRNPLAALQAVIELSRAGDDDDRVWAAGVLERQIGQLIRLTGDLLDVSRIHSGKIRLRAERLDARAVIAHALAAARPLFERRRHRLDVDLGPDPILLDADPSRLEQVVVNLLANAAKYTDNGGSITVTACCEGTEAVIRVRDTGVGIAPELLPRVFDMFMQDDASICRSDGGLGVGLALVRTLTELHGGTASATSAGVGLGSEFTVRLPLAPGPEPAKP